LKDFNIDSDNAPIVGIAIASFNRREHLKECLEAIYSNNYTEILTCVVDDGSSDGTWEMLNDDFPQVQSIRGDGNLWWAQATNKAIERCLDLGCEYVILLNDDCILQKDTILRFIRRSIEFPGVVIAPVVLDIHHPNKVWWAGSTWGPIRLFPFIWLIRQKYPHHTLMDTLPKSPYSTSEFTGRAVFIPKDIFEHLGLIDAETFPQYGSDNDFSLRVTVSGRKAIVDPSNRVFLYTEEAGQNFSGNLLTLPIRFFKLMFYRKHGEVARFWWRVLKRHAPWYAIFPSYIFVLILVFLRVFGILSVVYRLLGNRKNE